MSSSDGPKPPGVPRRDFLGIAVGVSGAAFTVAAGRPLLRFVDPPSRPFGTATVVGKLEDFPAGTAKTILIDERPVLVIRARGEEIRAFSALCTHLQCVVAYSPERNQIECPCHRGIYSIDGQNVAGPPPRPLEELAVTINDRIVTVSRIT
jgi:cytochrome b6-f complex iron-sulfur subunit